MSKSFVTTPQTKQKYNWDFDNDGKITSNDLIGQFDENRDGNLDAGELSVFAEQLASQLEYNNSLLSQLHSMEIAELASQHELQSKNDQIRKLSMECETLSADLASTKRQLKIAEGVSDNMSKQSRDARLETGIIIKL